MIDQKDLELIAEKVADKIYSRLEQERRLPPIQEELGRYRHNRFLYQDHVELGRDTLQAIARTVVRMLDANSKLHETRVLKVQEVAQRLSISEREVRKIYPHIKGIKTGSSRQSEILIIDDGKLVERFIEYLDKKAAGVL